MRGRTSYALLKRSAPLGEARSLPGRGLPLIWRFDGDFGRKNGFEVLSRSGDSAFRDS